MKTVIRSTLLALLLIPGSSPRGDDNETLGRLFFTPQQRAALDRGQAVASSGIAASVTLDGEIWRKGKRRARWINGQPTDGSATEAPAMPVGDTYHHDTGKSEGLLGEGRLIIKSGGQAK